MPPSALSKKLQIKPGHRVLVLHAPGDVSGGLQPVPEGVSLSTRSQGTYDVVLLFTASSGEVEKRLPGALKAVRPDGILWICWPKQSARTATDLTRDTLFQQAQTFGLRAVSNVSIDETWSALRFKRVSPAAHATRSMRVRCGSMPGARHGD
jgi:hypothetical protein